MKKTLFVSLLFLISCGKSVDVSTPDPGIPVPPVAVLPSNRQVNGNLVTDGNISDKFKVSSDGLKIVYVADESTDTIDDLYVVSGSDLGNKKNLTNLSILGKKVTQFQIAPNSLKVAFLADINTTGRYDLYTVNLDGSNLVRVNLGLSASGQVVDDNFKWTNDSSRIVFVSDEESIGVKNVYIVYSNATNRLRLNAVSDVFKTFVLSPDNSRVVYRTKNGVNPDIRSVTLNATNDARLNPAWTLPASGVFDFKVNSQSTKVVYRANQEDEDVNELYVANIDGTGAINKINGSIVSNGLVSDKYEFSSNGSKVIYIADQQTNDIDELFVSNIDGTNNLKLNSSLVSGGNVVSFKSTDDNSRVVYLADKDTDSVSELYSVSLVGGVNSKINSSLSVGEQVANQYDLMGSQVAYAMDRGQAGFFSIYMNGISGGSEIRLNSSITSGQGYFDLANLNSDQFLLTNDASKMILIGSSEGSIRNIYSVSTNGANFVQLNNDSQSVLLSNSSLGSTAVSVSPYVVYRQSNGVQNNLMIGLFK